MADNQDPLAALQQLLDEQKTQAGADGVASAGDSVGIDPSLPTSVPEQEKPKGPTAEEIAVLQKEKEAEDQVKIAEQLNKMQTELVDTPQYQARLSQKTANDAISEEKQLEERSRRIFQLKHLDP